MRTIAIKVPEGVHATLTLLAKIGKRPLVEELRQAVDAHIERRSAEVDIKDEASKVLAQIDADAASKREAIQALLGPKPETGEPEQKRGKRTRPAGDG
ncbi:MAG TPA: hypothetical protein VGB83_10595 [Actinomycetota bacterium]